MNEQLIPLVNGLIVGALSGAAAGGVFYGKKAFKKGATPSFDWSKFGLPVVVGAVYGAMRAVSGEAVDSAELSASLDASLAAEAGMLSAVVQLARRMLGTTISALVKRWKNRS